MVACRTCAGERPDLCCCEPLPTFVERFTARGHRVFFLRGTAHLTPGVMDRLGLPRRESTPVTLDDILRQMTEDFQGWNERTWRQQVYGEWP
jgi:hypothetical protein